MNSGGDCQNYLCGPKIIYVYYTVISKYIDKCVSYTLSKHKFWQLYYFRVLVSGTLEENQLVEGSNVILAPNAHDFDVVDTRYSNAGISDHFDTNKTMTINVAYTTGKNFNVIVDSSCDVNGLKQRIGELTKLTKNFIYLIYRDS